MVSPGAVVVIDSQFPQTAQECHAGINERAGYRAIDYLIKATTPFMFTVTPTRGGKTLAAGS